MTYVRKEDPLIGSSPSPGGGHEAIGRTTAEYPLVAFVRMR
jgi:hypothetical protein